MDHHNVAALTAAGPAQPHVLEVVGNGIVGGMEACVRRLIERLTPARWRFTVLLPYECVLADELRALQAHVAIVPMPEEPSWSAVLATVALARERGVHLLHAHLPKAHALAALAGPMAGRPVLSTIHGRQLTMLDIEAHRLADTHLHVVCEHSRQHALALGVESERLHCIRNGVDTRVFQPAPARNTAGALRAAMGLDAAAPLVGFVGRFSPEKAPELFVQMAALLQAQAHALHFVMLGGGPMQGEVQAAIDSHGLQQRVFLAGERSDMPAVYPELDLLVSSSHSEAMPLAQMEAMACGVPVVATQVGGVPELIEHRHSGWLVAPGSADALASAVRHVMHTPGLRETLGQGARRRAEQRMSLDASVQQQARLFERLCGKAGERAADKAAVASAPPVRAA